MKLASLVSTCCCVVSETAATLQRFCALLLVSFPDSCTMWFEVNLVLKREWDRNYCRIELGENYGQKFNVIISIDIIKVGQLGYL